MFVAMSVSPAPISFAPGTPPLASGYRISVKPSARSRSSATYCGETQMLATAPNLTRVVSGGGSAAAASPPRCAAIVVTTAADPVRKCRRPIIPSAPSSAR